MSLDPQLLDGPYDTVFDAGAFRGDFARACLHAWPDTFVVSFEPLEPAPDDLYERWAWVDVALGPATCVWPIFRNEFVPSSSILQMAGLHRAAFPYTTTAVEVTVRMRRLAEYGSVITGRALLKLDVQGYELHVLAGAGDTLARFDAVVLEVSHAELYHGTPTPDELTEFLTAAGFVHRRRVDQMPDPRTGALLQSDELFVRAA